VIPLFHETQKFSWILSLAVLSGSVVFLVVIIFLWFASDIESGVIWILWIVWLVMTFIDGLVATINLVTEVHSDGIDVYFGPLRFPRKKFTWQEIKEIYPRHYAPLAEYGGWGIRYGKSGRAYNIKGDQGIQLVLDNGNKFLIGTQQPEDFIRAVKLAGRQISEPTERTDE
jgi:hypothetical protein